jgi:hypothetical protein
MKRIVRELLALALCAGCRSSQPVSDPFLGPTTVPPPGTAVPPPGQPYYGTPAGAPTAVPTPAALPPGTPVLPRGGVPMNFAPAPAGGMSSFTPNVSPPMAGSPATQTPTLAAAPKSINAATLPPGSSAVRPLYGPPGGTGYPAYPQAGAAVPYPQQYGPQYRVPTPAQPIAGQPGMVPAAGSHAPAMSGAPAMASAATSSGVTPATHWTAAGQSSAAKNQDAAASGTNIASAGASPQSQIRIVEPAAGSTPPGLFQPSGPVSAVPPNGAAPSNSNVSSATMKQSLSPTGTNPATTNAFSASGAKSGATGATTRIPEMSELPPATGYNTPEVYPAAATQSGSAQPPANSLRAGQPTTAP